MSERQWPQEIVDAANRIGIDYPERCGQNAKGLALGCGQPLTSDLDHFKCVDCDVTFHRACARKHFADSRDDLHAKLLAYEHADRALLAQMAATILAGYIANPTEAATYETAIEDARATLAEIDKEPAR